MLCYQRERRIICGRSKATANYQEIEIYPMGTPASRAIDEELARSPRTPKAQQNQNAKAANRQFRQLLITNFTEADTHTTATYAKEERPETLEQVERDVNNFWRHLNTKCKAQGLPAPQGITVIEWQEEDKEKKQKEVPFHVHFILHCALTRDEVESCWHRKGRRIGWVNSDRLQLDKCSLEALADYLLKYTNRKHRWKRTRGIKDPIKPRPNDEKYTRRQVEKIAKDPSKLHNPDYWAQKYPGWILNEASASYNDFTGWHISLKMRRKAARLYAGGHWQPWAGGTKASKRGSKKTKLGAKSKRKPS